MKNYKISIPILVGIIVVIKICTISPALIERYYSNGLYIGISKFLRTITGWLPFSAGDILYIVVSIFIIFSLIRGIQNIIRKKKSFISTFPFKRYCVILLLIYIIFNVLWGINYNRKGIANQLGLNVKPYSLNDLKMIEGMLLVRVNESKSEAIKNGAKYSTNEAMFSRAILSYDSLKKTYPFLNYTPRSLKSSLFGKLGNYLGFSGYYNPFSGEAQVNTTIPKMLLPYTTCHEMAHQLGYAKEMEANFVGYLTSTGSGDELFKYSAYLDLFIYATREVGYYDSTFAKGAYKQLLPEVKSDLAEIKQFWRNHQNPVEPVITWLYGNYLKANQQPRGMQSYNEVTADLIAYFKKYGKI